MLNKTFSLPAKNKTTEHTEYTEKKIIYEKESYILRGCFFEVYKTLGCGFLEGVYTSALQKEFDLAGIPHKKEKEIRISYKGEILNHFYKADFICFDKIIIEIKAASTLTNEHRAQIHNYLKATGLNLGFLVNFGHFPQMEIERIVK